MPIEMYGSDAAGHLIVLDDPTPERTPGATPPEGEPPLPGADAPPAVDAAPAAPAPPADDLAALRRLIEEREQARAMQEAKRDAQMETVTLVLSGQTPALPETPAPAGPKPRPNDEDFTSTPEYIEAVADWKTEEKFTAFRQEQQQERQTAAQQQALLTRDQVVRQAEEAFVGAHPDYVEVVQRGLVAKTPQAFRQLIMLTDDAPAVAYAIAQDEALLGRLMQMPPQQLFLALGRLSGQHGGSAPPPAAPATAPAAGGLPPGGVGLPAPGAPGRPKPPPPRPLSGTGVAPVGGFREDMDMASYRKLRESGWGR